MEAVYKGAPSYAYEIGTVTVERSVELQAEPAAESTEHHAIEIPLGDFAPGKLDNLRRLTDSKANLIELEVGGV